MNRATRDKFASYTIGDLTTGNACWQTAPLVFEQLSADFGPFDVDLCADGRRHLLPQWFGPDSPFGPAGVDVLTVPDWSMGAPHRRGYGNPPYGRFVPRFLRIAKAQAACGFTSLILLPLRVTKAFKAHVLSGAADLIFPDRRLVFFEDDVPRINLRHWRERGRVVADGALFDSVLVRYAPGFGAEARPRISEWQVPPRQVRPADLDRARARLVLGSSTVHVGVAETGVRSY